MSSGKDAQARDVEIVHSATQLTEAMQLEPPLVTARACVDRATEVIRRECGDEESTSKQGLLSPRSSNATASCKF